VLLVTWTGIDLGVRLILPGYVFALALAGRAATIETPRLRWAARIALLATIASSAAVFVVDGGDELGYLNEAGRAGGGRMFWLSDSNVDWGQDLYRLADYLHAVDAPPVYLAYFGGGSPTYLGLAHETLPTAPPGFHPDGDVIEDDSRAAAPCHADRQLIAISQLRQLGVFEDRADVYAWLSALTPVAQLGTSIRVYDVTRDPISHVHLANLFGPETATGACEKARAIALDPSVAGEMR
jgi:hypothetical protein